MLFNIVASLIFGFAGTVLSFAQPTANFSSNTTSGCSPLIVQFNDLSTGNPTSWFWDFGNGNNSFQQNPSAIYLTPGTYTVVLVVSDGLSSDTLVQAAYITAYPDPLAAGTITATQGCAPFTTSFQDQSSSPAGITGWHWDFGDGNSSTLENPTHTYANGGTYQVTLTVTDANGCSTSQTLASSVEVFAKPTASIQLGTPHICGVPAALQCSASATPANAYTFAWTFGDGNTGTGPAPSHSYANTGQYDLGLIATSPNGCADTLTLPAAVTVVAPDASFTNNLSTVCEGSIVSFTAQFPVPGYSYLWDFGDGGSDTVPSPAHIYATAGTYSVSLIITEPGGCADTVVQTNLVQVNANPTADFSQDTSLSCLVPFAVNFTNQSINAVSWSWAFGDGNGSLLENPSHTFTTQDSFDVQLAVTAANGCSDTLLVPNAVQIIPPVASFTSNIIQFNCVPQTHQFVNTSTSPLDPITTYFWDFGDGTTSFNPASPHNYTTAGNYDLTLIVSTALGCSDTLFLPGFANLNPKPNVKFPLQPIRVCYGDTVNFVNTSTGATSFIWDFGDGSSSNLFEPQHVYADTGCFDVQLWGVSQNCPDSSSRSNYVCVAGPIADFTVTSVSSCDTPATFDFVYLPPNANTDVIWDFGDGNGSTLPSPSHTYTNSGSYTVTLIAEDNVAGCRDSSTQVVEVSPMRAGFSYTPIAGCAPLTIQVQDTSLGVNQWRWDFGNGDTTFVPSPSYTYTEGGTFNLELIASDGYGCIDTITVLNAVVVDTLEAGLFISKDTACVAETIVFNDTSASTSVLSSFQSNLGDGTLTTQSSYQHAYQQAGTYTVKYIVENQGGCIDSILTNIVVSQPTSAFVVQDSNLCPGETWSFQDNSQQAVSWLWDFGDSTSSVFPNPVHTYPQDSTYMISLVVTDSLGCTDTSFATATVIGVQANFGLSDTARACAPFPVQFTDSSSGNVTQWHWEFGDGSVSTQNSPLHTYANNGSFSVTLIASSPTGCADTLVLPNAIEIGAPPITLTVSDDTLCTGEPVLFTANTSPGSVTNWDWGNGTVVTDDDTTFAVYLQAGTFQPTLLNLDTNGCSQSAAGPPIFVSPSPEAAFGALPSQLCLGDSAAFLDTITLGTGPLTVSWHYGNGDSGTVAGYRYPQAGIYSVSLSVTDSLGCSAFVERPDLIEVYDPTADFTADTTTGCAPLLVNFAGNSQDSTIVSWDWTLGDGNTATGIQHAHTYQDSGIFDVSLVVVNAIGCRDTVAYPALVVTQLPVPPVVVNASVVGPQTIEVTAFQNGPSAFDQYLLLQEIPLGSGNFQIVDSSAVISDTSFVRWGLSTEDSAYCFRMQIRDVCGNRTDLMAGNAHCTVELQARTGVAEAILNWSAYGGWPVTTYEIYHVDDYDPATAQLVATVPGGTTTWRDTLACGQGFGYRIRALGTGTQQVSWSDTAQVIPAYPAPSVPTHMDLVTVDQNNFVRLQWTPFQAPEVAAQIVQRSVDTLSWVTLDTLAPAEGSFSDLTADIMAASYAYRILWLDSCEVSSPVGRMGTSIFLQVDTTGTRPVLNWNPYWEWTDGVAYYEIFSKGITEASWTKVATIPGTLRTFTDQSYDPRFGERDYRISAKQKGGAGLVSHSNYARYGIDLWIPNTITPNGDGANDVFLIPSLTDLSQTRLQVFSRWGDLVYEAAPYSNDWDGTHFQTGAALPDGTYYYILQTGAEGVEIKGYLTILR